MKAPAAPRGHPAAWLTRSGDYGSVVLTALASAAGYWLLYEKMIQIVW